MLKYVFSKLQFEKFSRKKFPKICKRNFREITKTDLNVRNKYNNNSKIFSKIEKRKSKSKVRAMKFCN